jgi:hypothetical protein
VHKHLGSEAESLLAGRARLVNVWRPLRGPVLDNPLAVADYRSIDPQQDLLASELRYKDGFVGETFSVKYNPKQRFYYVSEMQPNETLLLKCWDNKVRYSFLGRLSDTDRCSTESRWPRPAAEYVQPCCPYAPHGLPRPPL